MLDNKLNFDVRFEVIKNNSPLRLYRMVGSFEFGTEFVVIEIDLKKK